MTTLRKTSHGPDGLSGVLYTPASAEDDLEDSLSDTGKLTYVTSRGGTIPLNGDLSHHHHHLHGHPAGPLSSSVTSSTSTTTTCTTTTTPCPPPVRDTPSLTSYPYYDFQDTDNESDGGGCDSAEPSSPSRLPNGKPLLSDFPSPHNHHHHLHHHNQQHHHNNHTYHNNPHLHAPLSEKISVDSTGRHNLHATEFGDSRDLRELSKSPLSRTSRAGGKGRFMCCMMCIFFLSTAGLGIVLALACAGKVQLGPGPEHLLHPSHVSHSNGGFQGNRLDGEKVLVQNCETRDCVETAAAILSRMNMSADPCDNFYQYACGGYTEKTYLSWFSTRIRENPEEIIQHYRRFAIDRLSSSYAKEDSVYVTKARTLYRSCLFRPRTVDERTRTIVSEVIESLGGLTMPTSKSGKPAGRYDLTSLVANVTKLYGASPFFRLYVHGPKKLSIATRLTDYRDPVQSPNSVLSRSEDSRPRKSVLGSEQSTEELLLSLLARTNFTGNLNLLVNDYLRLEANIRRTFNGDGPEDVGGASCDDDEFSRSSFSELQFRHGSYGINWTQLVLTVLDLPSTRDVVICDVQLSRPLQHLLEITPKPTLWRFAILHTLLHSDLFLIVSGHGAGVGRMAGPPTQASFASSSSSSSYSSSASASASGDLKAEGMRTRSAEDQCLDLLEYVMPNLKGSVHCPRGGLQSAARETEFLFEELRMSLLGVLRDLFHISRESSWRITNSTVNRVKGEVMAFLRGLEADHDGVHLRLDEYDFSANVLELVKFRNRLYHGGKVRLAGYPDDVTAFGIRACYEDTILARPGPQLYHGAVPNALRFGSLGSYLAGKIADNLGLDDLLDHYSEGVLNHSAVLSLAVRLQCFVEMYSNIKLIDFGSQVYKLDGEENRVQLWKDQLALQTVMMAWRSYHNSMTNDQSLPGLALSRDQLFYVGFAQTRCEKVSERGILQHYVNQGFQMPNEHRVNGPLNNLHDFYRAFHCGNSKDVCDLF
ncbi:membrane metallo-endopeptidase-like 1 [Babylonia areolata]|uniref:membrane metallo-endopeptidase-like 1 n=1 Tax=Babylonia areolata TaxID=304850 RepID=UPI003FD306C6